MMFRAGVRAVGLRPIGAVAPRTAARPPRMYPRAEHLTLSYVNSGRPLALDFERGWLRIGSSRGPPLLSHLIWGAITSMRRQRAHVLPGVLRLQPDAVLPRAGAAAKEAAARRPTSRAPVLNSQIPFGDEIPFPSDKERTASMAESPSRCRIVQVVGVDMTHAIGPGDLTGPGHSGRRRDPVVADWREALPAAFPGRH